MTEIVTRVALATGALLGQGGVSTYLAECWAQILQYAFSCVHGIPVIKEYEAILLC